MNTKPLILAALIATTVVLTGILITLIVTLNSTGVSGELRYSTMVTVPGLSTPNTLYDWANGTNDNWRYASQLTSVGMRQQYLLGR